MEAGAAKNGASTSAKEEISREEERRPSLNSLALMRKATTPTDISSIDMKDWRDVVYEGVLLEENTQKFWVDKKHHKNCFLVLPKACDIAGGDEESRWSWITEKIKCFRSAVDIDIPKLKQSSYLFIQGRFNTRALSPNTTYEVAFVVKLGPDNLGTSELNLELDLPNAPEGNKRPNRQDLKNEPRGKWIKLRAGEFMMGPKTVGRISFALHETRYNEKSNLILRGVLIHPKDDSAKHNQCDAVEHFL
ncbi:uncharacterized protein PHLOEM PROTEIN 2-LIKE A4-like isoform X2 [Syzygium oleosum]|uniref:uncharacterized protein PHLOEM PROTEIN 2-LIKE A4-like isoform X2 n=1 Tax=Syzygium oleosum TaxID=219896 RepID=UPI0024BBB487|nr:uncharacterized protein PHLOEM PROTEIN 2-LIKE A4-like isoform X2 [Syzygium oleosum]